MKSGYCEVIICKFAEFWKNMKEVGGWNTLNIICVGWVQRGLVGSTVLKSNIYKLVPGFNEPLVSHSFNKSRHVYFIYKSRHVLYFNHATLCNDGPGVDLSFTYLRTKLNIIKWVHKGVALIDCGGVACGGIDHERTCGVDRGVRRFTHLIYWYRSVMNLS